MPKIIFLLIFVCFLSNCTFKKSGNTPPSQKSVIVTDNTKFSSLTSEQTDLIDLVTFGTEAELEFFLNSHTNFNLNFLNENGQSPLQLASIRTKDHHVDILIKYGASLFWDLENAKNSDINKLLTRRYRFDITSIKETDITIGHQESSDSFLHYETSWSSLDLFYEKTLKEISQALNKNDLLTIQKIQQKNKISCDLLSAMLVESLQFSSSRENDSQPELTASEFLKRANCVASSGSSFSRIIYNFEWLRLLVTGSEQTHILEFILARFPTTSLNIEESYVGKIWIKLSPKKLFSIYRKPLPETLSRFLDNHHNDITQSEESYLFNGSYQKDSSTIDTADCFIFSLVYGRTDRAYDCPSSKSFELPDKDD